MRDSLFPYQNLLENRISRGDDGIWSQKTGVSRPLPSRLGYVAIYQQAAVSEPCLAL
jgi:hypothetical protein